MALSLEGLYFFKSAVKHNVKNKEGDISTFRKQVWSRVTVLAQAALLMAYSVSLHTIRGVGSLVSGIFTLDWRKITSGFMDMVSLAVDVFAIAALGIVGVIAPKKAYKWSKKLLENDKIASNLEERPPISDREKVRVEITGIVRGILAFPLGIITGVTVGLANSLSTNVGKLDIVKTIFIAGLVSPAYGFASGFSKKANETVCLTHVIRIRELYV